MYQSTGRFARLRRNLYCSTALVVALAATGRALAQSAKSALDIPGQSLATALQTLSVQTHTQVLFAGDAVAGRDAPPLKGAYTPGEALAILVKGSGLKVEESAQNVYLIKNAAAPGVEVAQVTRKPARSSGSPSVETVVVTAEKKQENIQQVPIAITAMSQQQLTERQVAGGPDLVKEVPNLTFSKTNFTGYNLEIRGIGTQAISVSTDPAVAVAFNDTPFIRNHFFEQEFYDLQDVEVLRGPQGTLFGRNATAGVVDIKSALPTDQYEAMLSADVGNYSNRRLEGMLNIPIAGDKLDIRMAGEWTKRDGYTEDQELDTSVDGRDLWSGRLSIAFNPSQRFKSTFIWERFSEDDDRMRSAKQLCEKDPGPTSVGGLDLGTLPPYQQLGGPPVPGFNTDFARAWLSQGCQPTSLYSPSAYETPNGQALPFVSAGEFFFGGNSATGHLLNDIDPYSGETQPMNLREIQSLILPHYRAKNDTLEYDFNYALTPELSLISETGYNNDFLFSTEDFNRFDTTPGIFGTIRGSNGNVSPILPGGIYCDPQLGCSSSMVGEDLSDERASQFNQELRLTSSFKGPFNFSVGTNYTHYQTIEDYYVMFNLITAEEQFGNGSGPGQYDLCFTGPGAPGYPILPRPVTVSIQGIASSIPSNLGCASTGINTLGRPGTYIDPNPIGDLNGLGHNYFRSDNPYALNSWAGFGEVYYDVTPELKLTGGLRWTDDRKVFTVIPSQVFELGGGDPVAGIVKQGWNEWTGRFNASWSPELDFTDQSMFYASYAHGYKGGGANPPGPVTDAYSSQSFSTHPPTFAPEHIEAFELGTKNSGLDGTLTFDGDVFFYNYHGYQISQIVDRTSINLNFNATVEGAEVESTWEPLPGLKFNLAGGWEDSAVDKNQYAIDLMDRTAGMPGWVVVKPFYTETSNCILPAAAVAKILSIDPNPDGYGLIEACDAAYNPNHGVAPIFAAQDQAAFAAVGFNPVTGAPNGGQGFAKNLAGNKLPNMPPFTLSTGASYSMPVNEDWLATLRADFYWQGNTYARIFNDKPYDSIHGYTNLNLALMLNSQNGWDVMFYIKNVFDVTAITGAFLNSDDTALTTNVFVTDPRLFGVRVTKHLDENEGFWGSDWNGADIFKDIFSDTDGGRPPLWIEGGGNFDQLSGGSQAFDPPFLTQIPSFLGSPLKPEKAPSIGADLEAKVSFEPDGSDWVIAASVRYGRASRKAHVHNQTNPPTFAGTTAANFPARYQDTEVQNSEMHEILDFMAGKDMGLGMLGLPGTSVLSGGARYAAFTSRSTSAIAADPDANYKTGYYGHYPHHLYNGKFSADRSFRGVGPQIKWDASTPVLGNSQGGEFTVDWGANGAVLFGRQKARGARATDGTFYCGHGHQSYATSVPLCTKSHYQKTKSFNRSRMVVVPNIGAFAGISYRLPNAKLSFGYRADEFFGAIDGGIDAYKSENRGFFGPFATVSIGLGG